MALKIKNLGSYATIDELWEAHPEGGREGDYAIVGSSIYYWDKNSFCWVQDPGTGVGEETINGDLNVNGDLGVGGDAVINGRLYVGGEEITPCRCGSGGGSGGGGSAVTSQSQFKSIVFKRSATRPQAPNGGSYGNPVPIGWHDGVLPGTAPIWMSSRIFTSDGASPQSAWTLPALMSDTSEFDVEFSDSVALPTAPDAGNLGTLWFDPVRNPDADWSAMRWMATNTKYIKDNGEVDWTGWKIMLIKGEKGEDGSPGADGNGFQSAYGLALSGITPTVTSQGYPPFGRGLIRNNGSLVNQWSMSVSNLTLTSGRVLWMVERRMIAGVWAPWGSPVRISGADGTDGSPGADGTDIEFIYKQSNILPTAGDKPTNSDEDDYVPPYWSDNPSGVSQEWKYEWMCQRTKQDGEWSDWAGPFVWSAYGDKGMDGDGVEYIYRRSTSTPGTIGNPSYQYLTPGSTVPKVISPYRGDVQSIGGEWLPVDWNSENTFIQWLGGSYNSQGEWVPTGWSDDPTGVDASNKKEYVSTRKRKNGRWGNWSAPSLWATYSETHEITIGDDGYWYIDGERTDVKAEGEDGTGVAIKGSVTYLTNEQKTTNKAGITSATSLEGVTGMSIGDCYIVEYVDVSNQNQDNWVRGHIYVCVGTSASDWLDNWKDLGQFRGDAGTSAYMHIAWATDVNTAGSTPTLPSGATWSVVHDSTHEWSWMGIFTDDSPVDPAPSMAVEVNRLNFQKYKWNYIKGIDGADVEYAYIRTTGSGNPGVTDKNDNDRNDAEFLPWPNANYTGAEIQDDDDEARYTDDPTSVDGVYKYCWMTKREKSAGDTTWGDWSNPVLWAVYAESQVWVDTGGVEQIIVPCTANGKSKSATNISIACKLMYGSDACMVTEQGSGAALSRAQGTLTGVIDGNNQTLFNVSYSLSQNSTVNDNVYIEIDLEGQNSAGDVYTATKRIPIVPNKQGSTGATGPALRFRGVWDEVTSYVWDDAYRDCVKYQGSYYMVAFYGADPMGDIPGQDESSWTDMGDAKFFATELLLAENAAINMLSGNVINLFNTVGQKTASINADQKGSYCIYYGSGKKRMEFCYDGWIYYYNDDADNTIAWKLGPTGDIIKHIVTVTMTTYMLSSNKITTVPTSYDQSISYVLSRRGIYNNTESPDNGKVYTTNGINSSTGAPTSSLLATGTYCEAAGWLERYDQDEDKFYHYLPMVSIETGVVKRRWNVEFEYELGE